MIEVALRSLGTATPERYVTQREAWEFLNKCYRLSEQEKELYGRVLLEGPIRGRYLAVRELGELVCESADGQVGRFNREGVRIAVGAARKAMAGAGMGASDIGGIVVNTCTGYLCPGLSSYIAEELGLGEHTHTLDIAGMGCGGAIPNLKACCGFAGMGDGAVLSVAVEICSATFFRGEEDDLIISNCIFGDGASAAVLEARDGKCHRPVFVDFESTILARYREQLRYTRSEGRLKNVLSRKVPVIGARAVAQTVDRLLKRNDLERGDIDHWVVHPGGTTVLERVGAELGLERERLCNSYKVLENYGNMSSPSVMFVLEELLASGAVEEGQKGVMVSFGAGFSAFAGLVRF